MKSNIVEILKNKKWMHIAFLVVFPCIIYLQSVKFDYTNFDDNGIILQKFEVVGNIQNVDTVYKVDAFFNPTGDFYRPVQNLTFMLDAQVSQEKLWMFHLTNLIIHILTCISLYFFLQFLSMKRYAAFLLGLFFSVHPLFASGVGWVPSRGDILIGVLGLQLFLTFGLYFRKKKPIYLILHIFLFFITIFTKETTVLFPVLMVYFYFFVNNENPFSWTEFKKGCIKLIPFFISWLSILIFYLVLRHNVVANTGATSDVLGIIPFFKNNTVIPTIIAKFFVPFNLSPFPLYDNLSTIIGLILLLAIVYLTFEFSVEHKWVALMGLLWFLFFAIPPTIYRLENADVFFNYLEHRTYLPMIGIVIILGLLLDKHIDKPKFHNTFIAVYIPVIIIFGILAWLHCADYKDNTSINERAAKLNNPSALASRAVRNIENGDTIQALADIKRALELNPNDPIMYLQHGKIMAKMQNHIQAESDFALVISSMPNLVEALIAHSVECRYLGKSNPKKYEVALREIFRAQSIDPYNPKIYYSFGNLFIELNNFAQADSSFTKAIQLQPHFAEAYNNRAYARLYLQNYRGSITDCRTAIHLMKDKVNPFVYNNLGCAFRETTQPDSALVYINKAINSNPHFKEAYLERGKTYQQLNKTDKACADWNMALTLGNTEAQQFLSLYCK
jgi:tetratricopeptide (TPR) repeat protein